MMSKDLSMAEELDRKTLTVVRGGNIVRYDPAPWGDLPRVPYLPIGFPFPIRFPDPCPGEDGGRKVYPL